MAAMDGGLPTIKCSDCGISIDILQLADHVCFTAAPYYDEPTPSRLDRSATFGGASFNDRPQRRSQSARLPPPRIDPYAANQPFYPAEPPPLSPYSDSPSRSSKSRSNGRGPHSMHRSATSPMPRTQGPPSPDLMGNMDSAFPFFPTKRSKTPTGGKSKSRDRAKSPSEQSHVPPSPLHAPLSPRTDGGERISNRMDKIASGPFGSRAEEVRPSTSHGTRAVDQGAKSHGHKRSNTASSLRGHGHAAMRRSSSSSTASRGSTYSAGLPSGPKAYATSTEPMPPLPPQAKSDGEGIDAFLARLQKETMNPIKLGSDAQSRTNAGDDSFHAQPQAVASPAAAHAPNGGYTAYSPNMNQYMNAARNNSIASANTSVKQEGPSQVLSVPSYPRDAHLEYLHSPSDSGHSEDSYASSGFRSVASSRSSPPASEAGHSRQASGHGQSDFLKDEPMRKSSSPELFTRSHARPRARDADANGAKTSTPLQRPGGMPDYEPLESPVDPAIQRGLSPYGAPQPLYDPALKYARDPTATSDDAPLERVTRRPTTSGRGPCRGCSKPIVGKSVKDSSGRLTGRYHKHCFTCRTCNDPFPTAEFYVFGNTPYCEHHYHELNGSLCRSCNHGIEGQYLETDQREKFHPRCFSCATCRIVLRDDYYDIDGRVYCEKHVAAAMEQTAYLEAPGRAPRNMQKRRTRLMMMA